MDLSISIRQQREWRWTTGTLALPIVIGLIFRLAWILLEGYRAGDTHVYRQLAFNWVDTGTYGWKIGGSIVPVMMRMPGYPAFLAVFYSLFGADPLPVQIAQAIVDTASIYLTGALAARIAKPELRQRAAYLAMWLYALCPFTANFVPVLLTETLAIFLTALSFLLFASAILEVDAFSLVARPNSRGTPLLWTMGGLTVGLGTLLRPEMPLLLVPLAALLALRSARTREIRRSLLPAVLVIIGVAIPLAPWAVRNWHTFGKPLILPQVDFALPGEAAPTGINAWGRTWLVWYNQMPVLWAVQSHLPFPRVPDSAFDSDAERTKIEDAIKIYDRTLVLTPEVDEVFAEVAAARTNRHPIKVFLVLPLVRSIALWIQPRFQRDYGRLQTTRQRMAFAVVVLLEALNLLLLAVATWSGWALRHDRIVIFAAGYALLRSLFIAGVGWPEPRLTIELFPPMMAVIACGVICGWMWRQSASL